MEWELSLFGQHLAGRSGIGRLMEDLGQALAHGGDQLRMLGGGQPARIPQIEQRWRDRMQQVVNSPDELQRMLGNYEPPAGNLRFRQAIAGLFTQQFGWPLTADNVAVTMGGQTAFFLLFNALAGRFADGSQRKILLPLVPEYIGYANQSVGGELFRCYKPSIERLPEHQFKYHVDFQQLRVDDDIAAICVSRPTNPTGNVLTDREVSELAHLAKASQIPLIIDNAYGAPFPGAIFSDVQPIWNEQIILTLSLSKLGLPGTRTGIVIAHPEIIQRVAAMTSIVGLANSNVGQAIVTPLVEDGEILRLSREVIRPFYQRKSQQALQWMRDFFDPALPWHVHRSEGAFFLWLWLENLPITSAQLYERLKQRGVLVVPGEYFFFGLPEDDWKHRDECLRISFSMDETTVREGMRVIAEEVAKAYRGE